jgi:hypothetical protein
METNAVGTFSECFTVIPGILILVDHPDPLVDVVWALAEDTAMIPANRARSATTTTKRVRMMRVLLLPD